MEQKLHYYSLHTRSTQAEIFTAQSEPPEQRRLRVSWYRFSLEGIGQQNDYYPISLPDRHPNLGTRLPRHPSEEVSFLRLLVRVVGCVSRGLPKPSKQSAGHIVSTIGWTTVRQIIRTDLSRLPSWKVTPLYDSREMVCIVLGFPAVGREPR